jgi:putative adhesin
MPAWHVDQPQRLALDGEIAQVDVWLVQGKLRVVGTDDAARVEVTAVGRKGLTVTLADGVLCVRHELKTGWRHWAGPLWWGLIGRRNFTADISIAVPPSALGSLTMVSGSVVASGLRRGSTVDVTSGRITLMGLAGSVRAKTVSGSIEALGVGGDLHLETVSGDISLADSSADRVHARTISGSVTCDLDNPHAREVRLDTTSGEITVRVPEDADLTVHLSATSGRVTSAFSRVRPSGMPGLRTATGQLGSGAGSLQAYAISGAVSLLSRPVADFAAGAGGDAGTGKAEGGQ